MFSYYGSKTKIIKKYPRPVMDLIIEPFAGTASYSLEWFERDVILIDKYEVIISIWKWLQKCSPKDILSLPTPGYNQTVFDLNYDCDEARNFVGFIIAYACFSPARKASQHYLRDRTNGIKFQLQRIANDLFKIKHWQIRSGTYQDIKNQNATWFIDPPYQFGGHKYVESNKNINYVDLANWSKERMGQVIVCETMKADWLDFKPVARQKTRNGNNVEAIFTNCVSVFDNLQLEIFN